MNSEKLFEQFRKEFTELMKRKSIWKQLEIPKGRVLYYRHALKNSKRLNVNIMQDYLDLAKEKKVK